jgi:hypothetical protein
MKGVTLIKLSITNSECLESAFLFPDTCLRVFSRSALASMSKRVMCMLLRIVLLVCRHEHLPTKSIWPLSRIVLHIVSCTTRYFDV